MNDESLRQTILDALAEVAPEARETEIEPDKSFRDQIDLDSVDYLQFVLALERMLRIHVPDEDYPKLSSLSGALAYLESRTQTP